MGKRYYLELERKAHPTEELALVYCEERKGVGVEQRISPYEMSRQARRMNFEMGQDRQFWREEERGVNGICDLAVAGYDTVFWFSPRGGEYVDGRLVVARVIEVKGSDVRLECRGIVVKESPETMKEMVREMVKRGGVTMGKVDTGEDLRSQPVGMKLGEKDWCDFGEEMVGMPEVWQAIRERRDVVNKKKIEAVVMGVRQEMVQKGRANDSWLFEQMMRQRGFVLNAMGNHGGSRAGEVSPFGKMYVGGEVLVAKSDERLTLCNSCGLYFMKKKGKCPKCNKE